MNDIRSPMSHDLRRFDNVSGFGKQRRLVRTQLSCIFHYKTGFLKETWAVNATFREGTHDVKWRADAQNVLHCVLLTSMCCISILLVNLSFCSKIFTWGFTLQDLNLGSALTSHMSCRLCKAITLLLLSLTSYLKRFSSRCRGGEGTSPDRDRPSHSPPPEGSSNLIQIASIHVGKLKKPALHRMLGTSLPLSRQRTCHSPLASLFIAEILCVLCPTSDSQLSIPQKHFVVRPWNEF